MHTDLKYVYMVYLIAKNRNFICLALKLCKLWVSKDKDPLLFLRKVTSFTLQCNTKDVAKFGLQIYVKQVCIAPKFVPK